MNLFDIFIKILIDDSEVTKGIENVKKKADGLSSGLKTVGKAATIGFAAISTATVATAGYLKQATTEAAEYGDRIDKLSQKMGMTAESFQEWDYVMQICGTSIEQMQSGMKRLASAAETGNDAFARIGITQEQIASMSQEELFAATIEGLQNVTDTTERTYLASQLLGRGATELGPLLNMTAEETEALKQQLHDMGGVMSDEAVKASAKYQDALTSMQKAMTSLKVNFAAQFLPGLTTVMEGITALVSGQDGGVEKFTEGIEQIGEVVAKALPKAAEAVSKLVTSLLSKIGENIPTIMQTLIDIAKTIVTTLSDTLPDLIPQIVDGIVDAIIMLTEPDNLEALIEGAVNILVALTEGVAKAAPIIAEAMPTIVTNIIEALIKASPQIMEAGIQMISAIAKGAGQMAANIVAIIPKIISSIVKAFAQGVKDMVDAGFNLMKGLGRGIKNGLKGVLEDARNAGLSILNVFKGIFSIASPSKVMERFGKFLDEGLAQGVVKNSGIAEKAIRSLGGVVSGSITATVGATAGTEYTTPGRYSDMGGVRDLTIILELDKQQFAKAVYRMNNEEEQRVGLRLSGAY